MAKDRGGDLAGHMTAPDQVAKPILKPFMLLSVPVREGQLNCDYQHNINVQQVQLCILYLKYLTWKIKTHRHLTERRSNTQVRADRP
jgi:hypothetical protein